MGIKSSSSDIVAPMNALVAAVGDTSITLAAFDSSFSEYLVVIENVRPTVIRGDEVKVGKKIGSVASQVCGTNTFHVSVKEVPSIESGSGSPEYVTALGRFL